MAKMRKSIVILICFSLLAVMAGCGGGGSSSGGNTSPVAIISNPAEGGGFALGQVITFSGSGNDSEDGPLTVTSLVWTSDVDGQIGTGAAFTSAILSAGAHQITLTATDSGGAEGMDTVEILIAGLPDTGQTTSYTDTYGEDADYPINPPAYTKLDASGNAVATGWVMVRDDVTELIWEVKTDDGGIHDKDKVYTWQDAQDAQDSFIAQINDNNLVALSIGDLLKARHFEFFKLVLTHLKFVYPFWLFIIIGE
jgi:hypothetical protein